MKVLSISNMDIWPFGKKKGIPSIFASQKGLVERGHDVHFLCPLKKRDLPLYEKYEGIYIYRMRLPFNISSLSVYRLPLNNIFSHIKSTLIFNLEWFFFQICGLINGIKLACRISPDLIYAHSLSSAGPAYLLSRIFKSKLVIRIYGTERLYWQWQNLWLRLKNFRDYLGFKIPADYFIITNDGSCADLLARRLGVPQNKIRHWRNGVDFDSYKDSPEAEKEVLEKYNIKHPSKIIISTSRLLYLYGTDRLVAALPELFKKNERAICIILGEGEARRNLEKAVRRHNIQSRVLFLGMVGHDILNHLLHAADIFVFLPRYYNCTNTMWEAMIHGKCIVTVENEHIKEILTSEKDAILIHPDNIKKLPEILEMLLSNDDFRKTLGDNACMRAKEVLEPWPARIQKETVLLEALIKR